MSFDITDGRNRYGRCPGCGAAIGMGLVCTLTGLAVQCGRCGFRGPEIPPDTPWTPEVDRAAFEAWNALPRRPRP